MDDVAKAILEEDFLEESFKLDKAPSLPRKNWAAC